MFTFVFFIDSNAIAFSFIFIAIFLNSYFLTFFDVALDSPG